MDSTVRSQLIERHRETIRSTIELGQSVTHEWETDRVTDPKRITEPFEQVLEASNLGQSLLRLLVDAAETLGSQIVGRPVRAPPYLLVTSRGPLCRGTLEDSRRVVLALALFAIERNPPSYVFVDPTPEECLDVSLKG